MGHIILPGNSAFASLRNTANTKLLIHSDTTDESVTFADSSGQGHTVTPGNDAQHDIAQKKFGASSILFDGTGDYLSIGDSADWYMGTGAFTIDFWIRFDNLPLSDFAAFVSQYTDASNSVYFGINHHAVAGYTLQLRIEDSDDVFTLSETWITPAEDIWYHIAVIRGWGGSANSWATTVDGAILGTATTETDDWPNLGDALTIGVIDTATSPLSGWIDEFRVVKGEAMWTTQFTPPIGPYT